MAYIERLELTGIRSYSPKSPIQMEFLVPMTLIVGKLICQNISHPY